MAKKPTKARKKTSTSSAATTAVRSIHFYRADLGTVDSEPVECRWDLVQKQLLAADATQRLLSGTPDLLGEARKSAGEFLVAAVRRDNFPLTELGGTLSDLALPDGTGLAEVVHIRAFNNNIVGMVFNFYGPRVGRLARYLAEVCPSYCKGIRLRPLLRQDAVERLKRMTDVRMLTLRLYPSYLEQVKALNKGLFSTFDEAFDFTDAEEIELTARLRSRKASLAQRVATFARRLASRPDVREGASKLLVRGYIDGGLETVDALSDEFLIRRSIELQSERSRALRDSAAFEAIGQAYTELRSELEAAPAISDGSEGE